MTEFCPLYQKICRKDVYESKNSVSFQWEEPLESSHFIIQKPNPNADGNEPDFRQTLYWTPSLDMNEKSDTNIEFYTSNLGGEYLITAEGVTTDGKIVHSETNFTIKQSN